MDQRHVLAAIIGLLALSAGVAFDSLVIAGVGLITLLYGIRDWA